MPSLASAIAAEENKLLACIHCGLCLESCPTYVLTGDENDSPRGRIYLMRAVEEERLATDSSSFRTHIDRCLGCRACEPVCPAGVEYGQLLEASRAELFNGAKRGLTHTLLRLALAYVWLHPARLKLAFATARIFRDSRLTALFLKSRIAAFVSRRCEFALAMLESSRLEPGAISSTGLGSSNTHLSLSDTPPLEGPVPVSIFKGCVGEGLFPRVNAATVRVLTANGFCVSSPAREVCCGALHAHAGDLEGARVLARQNIDAFEATSDDPVVTNAGGCGAMLLTYGHLLAEDERFRERAQQFSARIRDVSQQLEHTSLKVGAELGTVPITYDASCHLLNGQRAIDAPLKLLQAVPNLNFVPLAGADRCCGAAGIYNLLEPEMSQGVLNEKLGHVRASGAEILATGNAGCQMQIGAGARLDGLSLRVCHPIELLDASYAKAGFYEH